ncbi:hypothetical protein KC342_g86 [Hortaea werneckii]|nr:hypothetical protein KC342_g86 [Hortaea werneckii]
MFPAEGILLRVLRKWRGGTTFSGLAGGALMRWFFVHGQIDISGIREKSRIGCPGGERRNTLQIPFKRPIFFASLSHSLAFPVSSSRFSEHCTILQKHSCFQSAESASTLISALDPLISTGIQKRVEPRRRRRRTLVSSPTTTSSALIPSTPSSSAVASTIPSSVSSAIPTSIPTTATRPVGVLTTSTTIPTTRRSAWRRTIPGRETLWRHRRREAMRSSLLSKLRWQRPKNLLSSLSVPVPAISAVPVSGTTTSVPVTRRGTVVPGREIHTAAITPVAILAELNTAMCTARLPRHLPRSLDIAIVEDRLGELDAGEEHGFMDAGDSRHMVAHRGAFVLIEARILVLTATFERESEFGVREELLFLFGFAGETFEVCGDFVVERVFCAEDQGVGAETVAAAFVLGQHRKRYTLPRELLPVEIDFEIDRVEFLDRRSILCHQRVENGREGMITSRRHDAHQLLVWPERLSLLKANNLLVHIDKVACEGGVVVGIVPRPRWTALEVV